MKEHPKANQVLNRVTTVLFIIYLIALIWILLFKLSVQFSYMGNRKVNLIPFHEYLLLNGQMDKGEIIMNAVIFIPLGIYAGILFKSWIPGKKIFFFFLVSALVEGLQFVLAIGAFDITDIVMNTLGGIIGWLLFKAIEKVFPFRNQAQKFIIILAAAGTGIMILFLFLLKMDLLPIKYK